MAETFELVVIGTGPAGTSAASRCRAAGRSVAIVDSRPFGGTCALRGCDPKKILVGAAEAVDWVRRMDGKGTRATGAEIAWGDLMRFKRSFTDPIPAARAASYARRGIVALEGRARFRGPDRLDVAGRELAFRHVLIASGARPRPLGFPGAEHAITSDAFLELEDLPERITFVGGGFISFEFAHMAARAGAAATILHRGPRPLEAFDPDLVARLVARSRTLGIDIRLETEVVAAERSGAAFTVRTSQGAAIAADLIVHGAGRVPDIDELDLDAGGIEHGSAGVKVNRFLQSVSNPAAFAAGDAADTEALPLTPVAGHEGRTVATNILEGLRHVPDYTGVPSVLFTVPPLASVGLLEEAARERGLAVQVRHEDTSSWYSTTRTAASCSAYKTLVEEGTGRIVGAHLLGPGADELVNLFALAMRRGIPAQELKDTLFVYPSHASDVSHML